MSPIHFDLLVPAFKAAGYNMVIPDIPARECVDVGLKFVNNDAATLHSLSWDRLWQPSNQAIMI